MFDPKAVEPMGDRLILMPIQMEESTKSGLHLARVGDDPPTVAEVVAAGEGVRENGVWMPQEFEVGDVVLYGKFSGTPVRIGAEEVIILSGRDVLVRLKRAAPRAEA